MTLRSVLLAGAAITFAAPAYADLSSSEVWAQVEGYYKTMGATVSAEREEHGSDLTLKNVRIALPMEGKEVLFEVPEIALKDKWFGGIVLTTSETMSATVPVETGAVKIALTQKGLEAEISGEAEAMEVAFAMAELVAEVPELDVAGQKLPFKARVTLTDSKGTETIKTEGAQQITSAMTSKALVFTLTAADAQANTTTIDGTLADLSLSTAMEMPAGASAAEMEAALKAGFKTEGKMASGPFTLKSQSAGQGGTMDLTMASASSALEYKLAPEGLSYSATNTALTFEAQAGLPFPIKGAIAKTTSALQMPVQPSEAATPFGLETRLEELTLNEELWAMFDPTKALPRDPATLVIDLDGTGKIGQPGDAMPGAVETVTLTQLLLKAMGAEITGKGSMTIKNPEMPMPVGAVDLEFKGVNGLLDKLVAAGLIPSEQVMGARMMLGLFAKPSGEDGYTSKIEMRDDGGLYANGQRLQ